MSASAKPAHKRKAFAPLLATANLLASGAVVFLTADGNWSHRAGEAELAETEDGAELLRQKAEAAAAANLIADFALVPGARGPQGVRPLALREIIRAEGPTVALPGATA